MNFQYKDYFQQAPAVGYETLIYDCLIGDATLFQRADQVEAAWALVEPVLEGWANTTPRHFPNYAAGSEGPSAANDLLARDGRSWRSDQLSATNAIKVAGTLEVVKDAGALAARAAEIIAGRACRSRAIPSAWCCRAAPRRAPPISCWPARIWTGIACEIFFGDERLRAARSSRFQLPHGARDAAGRSQCQSAQASWPFPPTARLQSCADRYDEMLRQQYGAGTLEAGVPLFHLTLLGLGEDGHTASLLARPAGAEGARALGRGRAARPRRAAHHPDLSGAEFQRIDPVSGFAAAAKRDALAQARGGALPAGGLKPQGEVVWLADEAAAGTKIRVTASGGMTARIEDYAMIGDCRTAALICRNGSIDWLCLPRFDSEACFAALLGTKDNGRWLIEPAAKKFKTSRRYLGDSLILETAFRHPHRRGPADRLHAAGHAGLRHRAHRRMRLAAMSTCGPNWPSASIMASPFPG